jgi:hypothetical protein
MNEIRFGSSQKKEVTEPVTSHFYGNVPTGGKYKESSNLMKIFGFFILAFVVIAGFVGGGLWAKDYFFGSGGEIRDSYSAVFLNNGQVYFGKMISNTKNEIVLNEVFYLQVSDTAIGAEQLESLVTQSQTRFNLVKLGTEMHGPTDEMFINKNNIIFYEYLRDDSAVVESIRNYR